MPKETKKPFAVGEQVYFVIDDRRTIFAGIGKIEEVRELWCKVSPINDSYVINKSDLYRTKKELVEQLNKWIDNLEVSNA